MKKGINFFKSHSRDCFHLELLDIRLRGFHPPQTREHTSLNVLLDSGITNLNLTMNRFKGFPLSSQIKLIGVTVNLIKETTIAEGDQHPSQNDRSLTLMLDQA